MQCVCWIMWFYFFFFCSICWRLLTAICYTAASCQRESAFVFCQQPAHLPPPALWFKTGLCRRAGSRWLEDLMRASVCVWVFAYVCVTAMGLLVQPMTDSPMGTDGRLHTVVPEDNPEVVNWRVNNFKFWSLLICLRQGDCLSSHLHTGTNLYLK